MKYAMNARLICLFALVLCLSARKASSQGKAPFLSSSDLETAIDKAAQYLLRSVQPDGSFVYRVNMNPRVEVRETYNVLRHAGAIYAMGQYYELHPSPPMQTALEKAAGFLLKNAVASIPDREDLLAVWSKPEINLGDTPPQAKLGGTGLGLVALLTVDQVSPGFVDVETCRKLGRFLLYMQKEDGGFHSKYIPGEDGRNDDWVSLYYPGEAALGLVMLYEKDRSAVWLHGAARAIAYLARTRSGRQRVEPDHWALLATARLVKHADELDRIVSKETLLQHAGQICESILADRSAMPLGYRLSGCFSDDGRTCPTATRLEGLLAALTFLPAEKTELRSRISLAVRSGTRFLIASQIQSGKYAGGIPRAVHYLTKNHPRFSLAFNERASEIRIDYVQHALSAMIQYKRQFL